jgi:hypothetical protein
MNFANHEASVSEAELRRIFSHFGTVQTCIVNREKRHAFVKMLTRKDAVNAKTGTEESKDPDMHFRVSLYIYTTATWSNTNAFRADEMGCWLWSSRLQRLLHRH